MSGLTKEFGGWFSRLLRKPKPVSYKPRPQGEVDYDALSDEVLRTYPKVIKRLAE